MLKAVIKFKPGVGYRYCHSADLIVLVLLFSDCEPTAIFNNKGMQRDLSCLLIKECFYNQVFRLSKNSKENIENNM